VSVKLNDRAFEYANDLIKQGKFVLDDRDDWSEHQPSASEENKFIEAHGFSEYARWHLGVDTDADIDTKARYKFPYGDFKKVHRCGVLAADSRAGQRKYEDVEAACAHLHGMLEALYAQSAGSARNPARQHRTRGHQEGAEPGDGRARRSRGRGA
jgi:hypothetical protein